MNLHVYTGPSPMALLPAVREAFRAVDPDLPIFDARPIGEERAILLVRQDPWPSAREGYAVALLLRRRDLRRGHRVWRFPKSDCGYWRRAADIGLHPSPRDVRRRGHSPRIAVSAGSEKRSKPFIGIHPETPSRWQSGASRSACGRRLASAMRPLGSSPAALPAVRLA
jgi:hypothetical protein